jgi:hypothetical protein
MYVKVPSELKERLLNEIKRARLKDSIKHFPALLLIFSVFFALVALAKGHALLEVLDKYSDLSETQILVGAISVTFLCTAALLIFFLRQHVRQPRCEEYLYCAPCDAVDSTDDGRCPICGSVLEARASFIATYDSEDKKVIARFGLKESKEA